MCLKSFAPRARAAPERRAASTPRRSRAVWMRPPWSPHVLARRSLPAERMPSCTKHSGSPGPPAAPRDPGAVAAGFAEVIGPGVAVRVEVDHRERPAEPGAVGPQQRQRDRVVAAEPRHDGCGRGAPLRASWPRASPSRLVLGSARSPRSVRWPSGRHVEVRVDAVAQHGSPRGSRAADRIAPRAVGDALPSHAIPRRPVAESGRPTGAFKAVLDPGRRTSSWVREQGGGVPSA